MILDSNGFMMMENGTFPGTIGDSCAETGRFYTLKAVIGDIVTVDLAPFITDTGVLRYPSSPWRENDTSGDQVLPLLAALVCMNETTLMKKVLSQLKWYETGNGDLVSPCLLAQMKRCEASLLQAFYDLAIVGQALVFKLPYRWSDSSMSFKKSADSSADYLNFINSLAFAHVFHNTAICSWAKKLIPMNKALAEVKSYYASEPNSQWIIDLYAQALPKIWSN